MPSASRSARTAPQTPSQHHHTSKNGGLQLQEDDDRADASDFHIALADARKTPTVVHPGYNIVRIRQFYMRKVKYMQNTPREADAHAHRLPRLEDIHPLYADLINVLYDDHYSSRSAS